MRLTLSYPERSKIEARLHQVCRVPEGSEFAVYDSGYDDNRVAIEMELVLGKKVTKGHVASIRKGVLAPLRDPRGWPLVPSIPVDKQIFDLQRDVMSLTLELEAAKKRIEALERARHPQGDFLAVG